MFETEMMLPSIRRAGERSAVVIVRSPVLSAGSFMPFQQGSLRGAGDSRCPRGMWIELSREAFILSTGQHECEGALDTRTTPAWCDNLSLSSLISKDVSRTFMHVRLYSTSVQCSVLSFDRRGLTLCTMGLAGAGMDARNNGRPSSWIGPWPPQHRAVHAAVVAGCCWCCSRTKQPTAVLPEAG